MVFGYSAADAAAPSLVVALWYLGALMVCAGGYWFWFFIRVDVYSEGTRPFQLVRADLFILSLLGSMTFALIWAGARRECWCTAKMMGHIGVT